MAIAPEDALGLDEVARGARQRLDAAGPLVLRSGRGRARVSADLRPQLDAALPRGQARLDGRPRGRQRGPGARGGHARRRGEAPRLRQRLPAPRASGGDDGRLPQAPAVPLPRLDVHARRQAPERAAHVPRDGLRPHDLSLVPVAVDVWRGFVVVNPDVTAPRLLDVHPALEPLAIERNLGFADWNSASTGSIPWRRTGRSSSRTESSATTARRCTRRASATRS